MIDFGESGVIKISGEVYKPTQTTDNILLFIPKFFFE